LACCIYLPDPKRREEPFDTLGAGLCAVSFGLLIFGFQAVTASFGTAATVAIIVGGAAVAAIFVHHESRVPLPVLPVDLLGRPALALSVAAALCAVLSSTALLLYVPFRLSAMGFDPAAIGAMIAPYALAILIVAPASGMLSDRVSPSLLGTAGLALALISGICLTYIPSKPGYTDIAWRTALCGVGFGMFFSPNGRLVLGAAPQGRAAGASSLLATTRMFGQALGATMVGGLMATPLGVSAPALAAAGLAALACLFSATRIALPDTGG
jgi:DHA2 family multidrug resistance protein-like MFS transporter